MLNHQKRTIINKKGPLASSSIVVDDILPKTFDANNEQNRIQNLINANTIFDQNSSNSLNENLDVPSEDPIEDILSSLQLHKRSLASNISSNKSDSSILDKNIKAEENWWGYGTTLEKKNSSISKNKKSRPTKYLKNCPEIKKNV